MQNRVTEFMRLVETAFAVLSVVASSQRFGAGGAVEVSLTPPVGPDPRTFFSVIAYRKYDGSRCGARFGYFKQRGAMGRPGLWVSPAKTEDVISLPLEPFVREYFSGLLSLSKEKAPTWVDIARKELASSANEDRVPSVTANRPPYGILPMRFKNQSELRIQAEQQLSSNQTSE
jgi:hypothetical protein